MRHTFLSPTPPPPAIRNAMAKAVVRRNRGLPVFDFSSGNVGNLPLNCELFKRFELEIGESFPDELKALSDGVKEGLQASFHPNPRGLAYSPTGGSQSVRSLVIRYFREVHKVPLLDTDLGKVIVTAGGQQAMTAALRSLKPGLKVLLLRWEYAPIPGILKDHNLKEVRVEINKDFSLNMDDFETKAEQGSVFYLSMPNNPTGYFSPQDFDSIVKTMSTREGAVIWDAPYLFTVLKVTSKGAKFDKAFLQEKLRDLERTTETYHGDMCILSSLSKTCLIAGLRFGFATASEDWVENMNAIIGRENLSSPTSSFIVGAEILSRFLENPVCHEWLCRILADRLTVLIDEVPDYLMLPENGMFGALYALLGTSEEASKFVDKLIRDHGVVTVPGNPFYGSSVNAVRLSLVSVPWSEGDEEWVRSVEVLKKALA